jgi:Mg2+ and Co2+ transporter CorA
VSPEEESGSALRCTLFDADGTDQAVELSKGVVKSVRENQLLWIELQQRDEKGISVLREGVDLHDEQATLLASEKATVQLLRYPERVHLRLLAVHDPEEPDKRRQTVATPTPIDVIVAPNVVITAHEGEVPAFERFHDEVRGDSAFGALDAAGFLTMLVDAVLDSYLEMVEAIERRVDTLDEAALRPGESEPFLREVVLLRRRVALLRRALAPHRWTFAPLARPDFELEGLGRPWPGIVDRLERTVDSVENARELLIGTFDVYMASSAQRTNEVMKTLTILSAVLLPAVVFAGVMGMNFRIGFFDNPQNFFVAVGGMAVMAIVVLGVARWRGWI